MKKIKDRFLRFLGYERIENIKVPKDYKTITIWLDPMGNIFWQ